MPSVLIIFKKQAGEGDNMNKKLLTLGTAALFVILFFAPQTMAFAEEEDESIALPIVYGIAYINGTLENPSSFFGGLAAIIGYKFLVEGNFVDGTITPAINLLGLRDITLPSENAVGANIRGLFCQFNEFEQIGETDSYHVNGTIYYLRAEIY